MVQYFLGVPDILVILHVLGSTLVVAALAALWCASRDRGPMGPGAPAAREGQERSDTPIPSR
jgi:cytochrome c oxidase assembly protein subunit 15